MNAKAFLRRKAPSVYLWAKYAVDIGALPRPWRPQTFNQHIVWRLLHERDDRLPSISDKVEVRSFVADVVGANYLIPQIAVLNDATELLRRSLPRAFVLKASFGSGMTRVVTAPSESALTELVEQAQRWLRRTVDEPWQAWLYDKYPRRLIVEEHIGSAGAPPPDYKFFVFGGEVQFVQVDFARFENHRRTLLTPDWRVIPCSYHYPIEWDCPRPRGLSEMLGLASRLAKPFEFMRVDLYDVDGRIYFGEMSPFPERGSRKFRPTSYDLEFGRYFRTPPR